RGEAADAIERFALAAEADEAADRQPVERIFHTVAREQSQHARWVAEAKLLDFDAEPQGGYKVAKLMHQHEQAEHHEKRDDRHYTARNTLQHVWSPSHRNDATGRKAAMVWRCGGENEEGGRGIPPPNPQGCLCRVVYPIGYAMSTE